MFGRSFAGSLSATIQSGLDHKPPRLKILHVIPSVSHVRGGPGRAIAVMEAAITGAGAKVTTATTDDDGPDRRLAIHARPSLANGASRFYARKWFDLYTIAPGIVPWLWRNVQ